MLAGEKILIVDDVEVNRIILRELFIDEAEVIEAENGLDALRIIEKQYKSISLIILDIIMPVMNGFELLENIKANSKYANIPILVVTGADDYDNKQKAISLGAMDLIVKPFDVNSVKNLVKNILSIKDINRIKEENNNLKTILKTKINLSNYFDKMPCGTIVYEIDNYNNISIVYANDNIYQMLLYYKDVDSKYKKPENVESLETRILNFTKLNKDIKENDIFENKFYINKNEYEYLWIMARTKLINRGESLRLYYSIFLDITNEMNYEKKLIYMVDYDSLTNILNKEAFYKKTHKMLIENLHTSYYIICINIERFTVVNDLFGLDEGDKLLKYIANCITENLDEETTTCGRLYADIFAICVPSKPDTTDKLVYLSQKYFSNYPLDMSIRVKFGIYRVDNHYLSINKMCDRANMSINTIKGNYKRVYSFYEESQRITLLEEQEIINDMYTALEHNQFVVYFQPKYHLEMGTIIGAEALVRWNHPKKGLIFPDKFINVFEKSGFITTMDEYVWEYTCKKIRECLDLGYDVVPISVNVSRIDIYNPDLCKNLYMLLKKYNIPVSLLNLEITETAYTENPTQLVEVVQKLKDYGFTVEMDDFGSGYSSLNMLNEVPVDVLKLDLRFLKTTKTYGRGRNILNSIVNMARWMNLPVVAEGIDSPEQVSFLKSIGCNRGQGFYFSKPVPYNAFRDMLTLKKDSNKNTSQNIFELNINEDEIWDPNSIINNIFNNTTELMGIFEMERNNFILVRANETFYNAFHVNRDKMFNVSISLFDYILDEDKQQFIENMTNAEIITGKQAFTSRWYDKEKDVFYNLKTRIKIITQSAEKVLFLAVFEEYSWNNNKTL